MISSDFCDKYLSFFQESIQLLLQSTDEQCSDECIAPASKSTACAVEHAIPNASYARGFLPLHTLFVNIFVRRTSDAYPFQNDFFYSIICNFFIKKKKIVSLTFRK